MGGRKAGRARNEPPVGGRSKLPAKRLEWQWGERKAKRKWEMDMTRGGVSGGGTTNWEMEDASFHEVNGRNKKNT